MVHTLTLNPALDYTVFSSKLVLGETNRASEATLRVGGKGINVSAVLSSLGVKTLAHGFVSGAVGGLIQEKAREAGLPTSFVFAAGESRINVKIKAETETEMNGEGLTVTPEAYEELLENLSKIKSGDFLVLAGSVPTGMRSSAYADIMSELSGKGIRFVVDATGEALLSAVRQKPFLIKPNAAELGELFGVKIERKEQAVRYAKELCGMGAENVIVSLGGEGAVFVSKEGEEYETAAPKGKVVDTVGAGDSVVAGFLYATLQRKDKKTAFLTGVAAGSATAFSEGFATKEKTEELLKTLL